LPQRARKLWKFECYSPHSGIYGTASGTHGVFPLRDRNLLHLPHRHAHSGSVRKEHAISVLQRGLLLRKGMHMRNASVVKNDRGQIIIVLALVVPILVLMAGLAIDAGLLYATKAKDGHNKRENNNDLP